MCSEHSLVPCPLGDVDLSLCSLVIWISKKPYTTQGKMIPMPRKKEGLRPRANYGLDWLCLFCLLVTSDSSRVILSILDRLCQSIRGHKEVGGRCAAWLCSLPNLPHFAFLALSLTQFPTPGSLQAWVFIDTIYIVLNFHYSHLYIFFWILKNDFSV